MILTVTANAAIDKRYVMEHLDVGCVNRVTFTKANAGGKSINVARVASIIGEHITATGFLGGHAGKFISERVEARGIISDFVWCKGESRTCINIWDEANHEQTEFLEPGFSVTQEDCQRLIDKFREIVPKCKVVTISGSEPRGADSGLYKSMVRIAEDLHVPVILDTSGKLLEDCLSEKPNMIKPNIDEIHAITGHRGETREELIHAAHILHDRGIETVVISLGAEGSLVSCNEGIFDVKVPRVEAVNTVGCGDSMVAGYAVGISRGLPMEEIIRLGSAVSVANALQVETGVVDLKDVEALLPKIRIRRIQDRVR